MKRFFTIPLLVYCLIALVNTTNAASPDTRIVRVAEYNVLFGNWGSPERIADMFKPHNFDIIGFNEVPNEEWTAQVGKSIGLNYAYVGKISSANHKDKYKSILSRSPLTNGHEIEISATPAGQRAHRTARRFTHTHTA